MKPVAFEFVRTRDIAETTRLLFEAQGAARLIAGGQSLAPMLNLRLAQPRLLIDITGIPELTRVEESSDAVTIGACITTANIEDQRLPGSGLSDLSRIATDIAFRAIRNRGTVGGSLCHADPAADWIVALSAFGAQCMIAGINGNRLLPVAQFITGAYETALAAGEMLEAIRIPRLSAGGRCGFYKVTRKAGEFASAIGAVLRNPDRGTFRLIIGAIQGRPIVVDDAAELFNVSGDIDTSAALALLDNFQVTNNVKRRQSIAAIARAHAQVCRS
jgi:aerobic carbon-monoxide dehydrogenase medium subunit